eukprot:SAG31_NODE_5653_length_2403_cov_1.310330_2_plen_141_part_00
MSITRACSWFPLAAQPEFAKWTNARVATQLDANVAKDWMLKAKVPSERPDKKSPHSSQNGTSVSAHAEAHVAGNPSAHSLLLMSSQQMAVMAFTSAKRLNPHPFTEFIIESARASATRMCSGMWLQSRASEMALPVYIQS